MVCSNACSFRSLAYHFITVTALRSLSQQHAYPNQRNARTRVASEIYNTIPLCYRQTLDQLIRAKAAVYPERALITHPTVRKSEISAFLTRYLPQQTDSATELLRAIQNVEVIDLVSGELVPMFVEG